MKRSNIACFKIWCADQPNIENIPNGRTRTKVLSSKEKWLERQKQIEDKQIEEYFNNKNR